MDVEKKEVSVEVEKESEMFKESHKKCVPIL